jgi:hypothetical protein
MIRGTDYTAQFFAFYDTEEGANHVGDVAVGVEDTFTIEFQIDTGTKEVLAIELTDVGGGYYNLVIPHELFATGSRGSLYSTSSNSNITVIPWQNDTTINEGPSATSSPRELSQAYGPKRVKTPNMEVEQFDPLTMLRAQERENAVAPSFPWHMTIASPNRCKYR